jgi:hypothetical protein
MFAGQPIQRVIRSVGGGKQTQDGELLHEARRRVLPGLARLTPADVRVQVVSPLKSHLLRDPLKGGSAQRRGPVPVSVEVCLGEWVGVYQSTP